MRPMPASRRRTPRLVAASLVAVFLFAFLPSGVAAAADTGAEADFIAVTNSTRANRGLGRLTVDAELTTVARRWSARMASENRLAHNPNLASEVRADWEKLGENVGTGDNVTQIHDAFM